MRKLTPKKELSLNEIVELKKASKYAFKNYKPNKNCKPVIYKGKEYKSKAQCIALEKITRKELDTYLNNPDDNELNANQS